MDDSLLPQRLDEINDVDDGSSIRGLLENRSQEIHEMVNALRIPGIPGDAIRDPVVTPPFDEYPTDYTILRVLSDQSLARAGKVLRNYKPDSRHSDSIRLPAGTIRSGNLTDGFKVIQDNRGYEENLYIDSAEIVQQTVRQVEANPIHFGKLNLGSGARVLVDFFSPNEGKAPHGGHERTLAEGEIVSEMYMAAGYTVIKDNHVGDWGTHLARLGAYFEANGIDWTQLSLRQFQDAYIDLPKKTTDPEIEKIEARWRDGLLAGSEQTAEFLSLLKTLSLEAIEGICNRLGIHYNYILGESAYVDLAMQLIPILPKLNGVKEDNGAIIHTGKGGEITILVTRNGEPLYPLRDVATLIARNRWFDPEKAIYVMGANDKAVIDVASEIYAQLCGAEMVGPSIEYYGMGTVSVPKEDGKGVVKMSSRMGNDTPVTVIIDRVEKTIVSKMISRGRKQEMARGGSSIEDREAFESQIYQEVEDGGVEVTEFQRQNADRIAKLTRAAILYAEVAGGKSREIVFDIKSITNQEGNSGVYLLYQLVRLKGILGTAEENGIDYKEASLNFGEAETADLAQIATYMSLLPIALATALKEEEPFVYAETIYKLARRIATYYSKYRVLGSPEQASRLRFLASAAVALENGIKILGIQPVERI